MGAHDDRQSPAGDDRAVKVALFLPNMGGGGAERVFALLAEALADRGIDTEVVLVRAEGPHLARVTSRMPVIDLDADATRHSVLPLARYLRRRRPDVLLSALAHANIAAVIARRLARVDTAVVITHHLALTTGDRSASSILWSRLRALFYPWADGIVAVSKEAADQLAHELHVGRDRVQAIANPVITPDLIARGSEALEHPWFQPGSQPVVVGIGRLSAQKDFLTLVRAFARLHRQRPVRLVILGEGEERTVIEAAARELGVAEDVLLPGFVDNPYAYLARASVFALSSIYEGLPTVVIEALALGTPVVSTDCPSGPREILEGGDLGRLVPVRDPDALAAGIGAALAEGPRPVPAERLRQYRQAEAGDAYLRMFERLGGRPPSGPRSG